MTPRKALAKRQPMDNGAHNWIAKTSRTNFWRVAGWYDIDDLEQDGRMCYYLIRQRYPDAVDRPHIMALLKRTFINHIHQLAKRANKQTEIVDTDLLQLSDSVCEHNDMAMALAEAPDIIRNTIVALMEHAEQLGEPFAIDAHGHRETMNDRICRIVGVNPNITNLHGALRQYLENGTLIDHRILRGLWQWSI